MKSIKPIAQRTMLAVDKKTGVQREAIIEIFAPRPLEDSTAHLCLACITGIDGESYEAGGVDSLQALSLALMQIKKRFGILKKKKYDLLFPDGHCPIDSFGWTDIRYPPQRRNDSDIIYNKNLKRCHGIRL